MNATSKLLAALVLACAPLWSAPAHASPIVTVLAESFDDVSRLDGWYRDNRSTPQGLSWFQGNPGIFAAQQGPASSYIGANHLSAANGSGTVDNWLITPTVVLFGASALSFFTRTDALPGFADRLEIRFNPNGASSDPADFTLLLDTIGGAAPYPVDWQGFLLQLNFYGTGRFAFRYLGDAAALNYIGIDSVTVTTVPEPAIWLILAAGLCALALQRRHAKENAP